MPKCIWFCSFRCSNTRLKSVKTDSGNQLLSSTIQLDYNRHNSLNLIRSFDVQMIHTVLVVIANVSSLSTSTNKKVKSDLRRSESISAFLQSSKRTAQKLCLEI